jgi:DNA polymerase III epsilon subunit-like protein
MLIVDTETTGLDPKKHSIVSIGAVDFFHPENTFYVECKPWHGAEYQTEALAINGFTKEELEDPKRKTLYEAMNEFIAWTNKAEDKTLGGHNFASDIAFLRSAVDVYNINWSPGRRVVDTHSLCYSHHLKRGISPPLKDGRTDLSFDKVLVYVGLPEEPKPHNALTGAKMAAEVFSRLIYRKALYHEFEQFAVPEYLK